MDQTECVTDSLIIGRDGRSPLRMTERGMVVDRMVNYVVVPRELLPQSVLAEIDPGSATRRGHAAEGVAAGA